MKKIISLLAILIIGYLAIVNPARDGNRATPAIEGDSIIAMAFDARQSGLQVEGQGIVSRVLPDDTDGNRHQRFILELASGQTLLIAHNIDLAPRINGLSRGDTIGFNGEYEWSEQGGMIHWTHTDPSGKHPAGWLSRTGRRYQ